MRNTAPVATLVMLDLDNTVGNRSDAVFRWMVGDSAHHDIGGAQALGLRTAWLNRQRSWPVELPEPTVVLDDLAQLAEAIRVHG